MCKLEIFVIWYAESWKRKLEINHRIAQVRRYLKRSSGPAFCGKGSLDETI